MEKDGWQKTVIPTITQLLETFIIDNTTIVKLMSLFAYKWEAETGRRHMM